MEGRARVRYAAVDAVARRQRKYLESGDERDFVPLSYREIADEVGCDQVTIWRIARRERLNDQPLVHFIRGLGRTRGTQPASSTAVRAWIARLVADEQQASSDQQIVERLRREGVAASRRQVTKLRRQLGIAASRPTRTGPARISGAGTEAR